MEAVFTQSRLRLFSPSCRWKNTMSVVTSVSAFWRNAVSGRRTAPGSRRIARYAHAPRIDGIHEIAADHKGRDAAFP